MLQMATFSFAHRDRFTTYAPPHLFYAIDFISGVLQLLHQSIYGGEVYLHNPKRENCNSK